MKRKKKSSLNLAVLLMIISSFALSTVQVGFSFFSTSLVLGGLAIVDPISEPETAVDNILSSNSAYITTIDPSTSGNDSLVAESGYTSIIRAPSDSKETLNNYIKFSADATELWRIVGMTSDGIKVVLDTSFASGTVAWDTSARHFVPIVDDDGTAHALPYTANITSLTNASDICVYLNTTYYNTLTSTTNANYVNPDYINHTGTWDITPMLKSGLYATGMSPNNISATSTPTGDFKGLAIGLLNYTERCMVSETFTTVARVSADFTTFLEGWLSNASTVDYEFTLTDILSREITTTSYTSSTAIWTRRDQTSNSGKTSTNRHLRPAMYIYSDLILTTAITDADLLTTYPAGSQSNPFIVTGRS